MIIDFNNLEEQKVENFLGGQKSAFIKTFVDNNKKFLFGRLLPGASIGGHTHETNCEIMYIVSGKGKIVYGAETVPLKAGMCHFCPRGKSHSLINDSNEDLTFFAFIPEVKS